jgi:3-methyladenine DNA glycosylase AlkD
MGVGYNEKNDTTGERRMMKPDRLTEEIRQWIRLNSEEEYAAFQRKLLPTLPPEKIHGVRTPALRKYAKELKKREDIEAFLRQLPHERFEEDQLHAFILSEIRDPSECLEQLDRFLPYIDNWATCDQLSPKAFKGRFSELLPHIRRWMADPAPYTCRFGLGMLMRYGLGENFDPAFLAEAAAPSVVGREAYYVRMMVAWFFATALAFQYEAALPYLTEHRLPHWIHNKTIQKACESYRIPSEYKGYLKSLRQATTKT